MQRTADHEHVNSWILEAADETDEQSHIKKEARLLGWGDRTSDKN